MRSAAAYLGEALWHLEQAKTAIDPRRHSDAALRYLRLAEVAQANIRDGVKYSVPNIVPADRTGYPSSAPFELE
jgi:hypothetical protein